MAAIIDGAADLVRGTCGSRLPCLVPVKAHLYTRQVSGFTPVGLWMPPNHSPRWSVGLLQAGIEGLRRLRYVR